MSKKIRILSIDGGGIRGILAGEIIAALEKKLQKNSNNPKASIADYFDLIAGTSTGGILTCLYLLPDASKTRPFFSAKEAVDLYIKHGSSIFRPDFKQKVISIDGISDEKYPAKELENILYSYFKDAKLSELLKPTVITSYDIFNRKIHLFKQHEAKNNPAKDYNLSDVTRATSAAPTYFETAYIHSLSGVAYPLVDGGLFANNPAMCAFAEAIQMGADKKRSINLSDIFLFSVGTGNKRESYSYEKIKDWGILRWMEPILDIMSSGASEATDFQLKQLFNALHNGKNYIRINPDTGSASSEMDNASPRNIEALVQAGKYSAEKYDSDLESISSFLIATN